jgi:hypothetical protein
MVVEEISIVALLIGTEPVTGDMEASLGECEIVLLNLLRESVEPLDLETSFDDDAEHPDTSDLSSMSLETLAFAKCRSIRRRPVTDAAWMSRVRMR